MLEKPHPKDLASRKPFPPKIKSMIVWLSLIVSSFTILLVSLFV